MGTPPAKLPTLGVRLVGGADLDHLAVIGDGAVIASYDPHGDDDFGGLYFDDLDVRWVVAMAWSEHGAGWAVSGPVWVEPPGGP